MLHQLGFPAIIGNSSTSVLAAYSNHSCKIYIEQAVTIPFALFFSFYSSLCHLSLFEHQNEPLLKLSGLCLLSQKRLRKPNVFVNKVAVFHTCGVEKLCVFCVCLCVLPFSLHISCIYCYFYSYFNFITKWGQKKSW